MGVLSPGNILPGLGGAVARELDSCIVTHKWRRPVWKWLVPMTSRAMLLGTTKNGESQKVSQGIAPHSVSLFQNGQAAGEGAGLQPSKVRTGDGR